MKKIKLGVAVLILGGLSACGQSTNEVETAKKLILENVANTTWDSPDYDDSKFEESEENMYAAYLLLKNHTDMDIFELEEATGAAGYYAAMQFANSPTN